MPETQEKMYVVYDERALTEGTDNAAVMVACGNLKEARSYARKYGRTCPVYSYDVIGDDLENETYEGNI